MSALRLDLIVRRYGRPGLALPNSEQDKWTWRLWSGSRVVSTSGNQLFSRRIDCVRGAEVGAGVSNILKALDGTGFATRYVWAMSIGGAWHHPTASTTPLEWARKGVVEVRILDERVTS